MTSTDGEDSEARIALRRVAQYFSKNDEVNPEGLRSLRELRIDTGAV